MMTETREQLFARPERYAMFAALVALATVVASIIPGCIDRLR